MPEGQVSHRNAQRLEAALTGHRLERVDAAHPRVAAQRLTERLRGERVEGVEATGKHMLIRFTGGRVLHSHLGMVGAWRLAAASRPPRPGGLWLALWTETHVAAQFRGPTLRLYEPGEPVPALTRVGPDLLDATRDPSETARRGLALSAPERPVADALLDQRVMAGIGNVYRSETLFLCGIDPRRPAGSLDAGEAGTIGATAARLLGEGVREPGPITTYRPADPRSRERTWVYGRAGRPCRRCGTPIRTARLGDANRAVFWCPTCQAGSGED